MTCLLVMVHIFPYFNFLTTLSTLSSLWFSTMVTCHRNIQLATGILAKEITDENSNFYFQCHSTICFQNKFFFFLLYFFHEWIIARFSLQQELISWNHEWKPRMGITNGNHKWKPRMGTTNGDHEWEPQMKATNGDHKWNWLLSFHKVRSCKIIHDLLCSS